MGEHDALCLAALGLVLLEGGLYWLMMRAGGLAFWRIAVPIWALAVGQIAWLLGAYAVGRLEL